MEAQATSDVVKTSSPVQTQKIAQKLAQSLKGRDVVALFGDLGAGKTTFVQGLAKGLGIKKRIISPSFVFMRSYPLVLKGKAVVFHHIDLYRGESPKDFTALALDEVFAKDTIVIIEWAEKIKEKLPKRRIDVYIERVNETTRKIKITPPPMSFPSSHLSFPRKRESKNWISVRPAAKRGPHGTVYQVGNDKDINRAVEILKSGGVIIFPTDTVYGIGCRFDSKHAVNRIYQIKGSPKNQPFPILVSSIKQVENLADISPQARELMEKYWPGGLTVILQGKNTGKKYGFRMPNSDLVRSLIKKVGPLVGTSANFHGDKTPTSYKKLNPDIIKLADYTIKGECQLGAESTVVDVTSDQPKIIRQGAVLIS